MTKMKVWTATTDGDNCCLTTTVHATKAEAEERVRGDLSDECAAHQLASLDAMTGNELSEAWEGVYDGACIIEEHEIELPAPVAADPYATLCDEYVAWNKLNGLSLRSADEHLFDESLTAEQRAWLAAFSARWDAVKPTAV